MLALEYDGDLGWLNRDNRTRYPDDLREKIINHLSEIVSRCKLTKWQMQANPTGNDVSLRTWIAVHPEDMSDIQFNCLTRFVHPLYITLNRTTN
jgi:hypothetical protein